jgi:hypothetical protein
MREHSSLRARPARRDPAQRADAVRYRANGSKMIECAHIVAATWEDFAADWKRGARDSRPGARRTRPRSSATLARAPRLFPLQRRRLLPHGAWPSPAAWDGDDHGSLRDSWSPRTAWDGGRGGCGSPRGSYRPGLKGVRDHLARPSLTSPKSRCEPSLIVDAWRSKDLALELAAPRKTGRASTAANVRVSPPSRSASMRGRDIVPLSHRGSRELPLLVFGVSPPAS